MNFIIAAILICLFSSVIPIANTDVWYSQFVALFLMGGIYVLWQVFTRLSWSIALIYGWMIFSTIFTANQEIVSLLCLVQVSFCLLFAILIKSLSSEQTHKIIKCLFWVLIVQTFMAFIQKLNLDPIFHMIGTTHTSDTVGFSGSHNQFGLSLAALSVSAWYICPLVLPFVFLAIVFSKTFSALIGFCIASIFMAKQRFNLKFKYMVAIVVVLVTMFLFIEKKALNEKFIERQKLWNLSLKQVSEGKAVMQVSSNVKRVVTCNKWFGFGFGRFMTISPNTQDMPVYGVNQNNFHYEHAHNDYVEAVFDMGWVAVFFMGLVALEVFVLFFLYGFDETTVVGLAGIIAYASCALSIYTVHTAVGGFFLSIFIGLFYAGVRHEQERIESRIPSLVL